MEIIVGKLGNQIIPISDTRVSRKHCKLTEQADGTFLLEDLDSTNGTFVDGYSVIRKIVTLDTVIQLGPEFRAKVADLVGSSRVKTRSDDADAQYEVAFNHLEEVYEQYSKARVRLLRDERKKGQLRSLPMFVIGLVSLLFTIVPDFASYRVFIVLVSIVCAAWGARVAFGTSVEFPEKMEALTKQFKIDYVCPKCGNFMGDIPFENLKNRKVCGFCKCKWVK